MAKKITLVFCGEDGNAGKATAAKLRNEGAESVMLRDAASFIGMLDDPADQVVIMPDVTGKQRQMILDTYPNALRPLTVVGLITPNPGVKRGPGRPRKVA